MKDAVLIFRAGPSDVAIHDSPSQYSEHSV